MTISPPSAPTARDASLALANERRLRISELRRSVTRWDGRTQRPEALRELAEIIERPDTAEPALRRLLVWNVLAWAPRVPHQQLLQAAGRAPAARGPHQSAAGGARP
jgi:hypothetical protein